MKMVLLVLMLEMRMMLSRRKEVLTKDGQEDEHHLISGFLLLLDTQKVQIERPLLSPENNYLLVLALLTRISRDNEQC